MPNEPETPTPTDAKTRKIAEQDQKIANAISQAEKTLTTARDSADILALLTPRGYDAAALDEALTSLQVPAQAAYDARQSAMAQLRSANEALAGAENQERKDFADYREIARAAFPGATDQVALGLKGTAPKDLEKFLTAATASYGAGKKAPYTAKLTVRGYAPAAIDVELQGLKGVANFAKAQATAKGAAQKATTTRDAAAKALATWIGEFRKVAKRTLRTRPDLLAALEL
jgi:hypothetical protein